MAIAETIDLTNFTRHPVIKSIDNSELPELSSEQTLFIPMCERTNRRVYCDEVVLVNQGEPNHIDTKRRCYVQPVKARLKSGGIGCTNCQMPHFPTE